MLDAKADQFPFASALRHLSTPHVAVPDVPKKCWIPYVLSRVDSTKYMQSDPGTTTPESTKIYALNPTGALFITERLLVDITPKSVFSEETKNKKYERISKKWKKLS